MRSRCLLLLFLLLILLQIAGSISASILSENNLDVNGKKIQQLLVQVDSASMSPNLNIGDLVVVENLSRSNITTWEDSLLTGYSAFNNSGDIILYQPYGKEMLNSLDHTRNLTGISYPADKANPIISRALEYVEKGQPMWDGGPAAPFSGYITKGDHNDRIDQIAGEVIGVANSTYLNEHQEELIEVTPNQLYIDKTFGRVIYELDNKTLVVNGISFLTPVKKEWVIGIVRVKIPYSSDWTKLLY